MSKQTASAQQGLSALIVVKKWNQCHRERKRNEKTVITIKPNEWITLLAECAFHNVPRPVVWSPILQILGFTFTLLHPSLLSRWNLQRSFSKSHPASSALNTVSEKWYKGKNYSEIWNRWSPPTVYVYKRIRQEEKELRSALILALHVFDI